MEDRYTFIKDKGIVVAMVCDGHGGYKVANDTAIELPPRIVNALDKTVGTNVDHATAIRNVIMEWGDQMKNRKSGSTLTGIAIKNGIVYIYNIGDSRTCIQLIPGSFVYMLRSVFNHKGCFVCKLLIDYNQTNFFCTRDHDSKSIYEVRRVTSAGGEIIGERLNGILSVTRALGDIDVGPGIDYIPDVFWVKSKLVNGPIFLYSDGIYEPQRHLPTDDFNDRGLYEIAKLSGADAVVKHAEQGKSDDNLTALIVIVD